MRKLKIHEQKQDEMLCKETRAKGEDVKTNREERNGDVHCKREKKWR